MSASDINISCIILAGGEGKRAGGRDKGLIPYKGKPIIEYVIDSLRPQVDEFIISANRNLVDYEASGFKVVTDNSDEYLGPMSGIASALPYCSHEWVLVAPCDMPDLPTDTIEKLLPGTKKSAVSIAAANNKTQLVFLMKKSLINTIEQQLSDDNRRLMDWVNAQSPEITNFSDSSAFINLNNSDDFIS